MAWPATGQKGPGGEGARSERCKRAASTRVSRVPESCPYHINIVAANMKEALSRSQKRSVYRRDGGSTRARLGMAAPARTQIRCRTPRAALGRAGGTIGDRPIDATGAAPEHASWHCSTGMDANSMSDAASGARAGRRHDRRSAYRRDGSGTRTRLGIGRSRGGGGPGTVDDEEVAEDSEEVGDKMTYSV